MPAVEPSEAVVLPPGLAPAGTTELGIDIIRVARIRAALEKFGPRFSKRVLTESRAALRARPARDDGRPVGGQGGGLEGPRARRPRDRLARHRDRAAADRPAVGPAPWARRRASRAARDGADRGLDHPRVGLRGGDRVRRADGRRPVRLPARHRGPPRRARAAHPRADRAPARDGGGRRRRGARLGRSPADRTRSDPVPERGPVGFGRRDAPREEPGTDPGSAFPAGATQLDDDIVGALIPERPARGHKGSFGKLLVIAGSLDYAGAALLVCRAAGRSGVGLVTLAVPESLQPLFAAKVVEATTMALPEDDVEEVDPEPAMARILDHEHDAIVVGPGLRPGLATTELVRSLLPIAGETDAAPLVLDAEALRSMATMDGWWTGDRRPAVLTPHAGEFARLRAGSGDQAGRRRRPRGRRRGAPGGGRRCRHDVGLGRRAQGRPDDHRRARRQRRDRAVREPGARHRRDRRRPGGGDRRAARAGPRTVRRGTPRASTCTGLAGDAGRERFGDAGLLASDLPDGLARRAQAPRGGRRAADRHQAARVRGARRRRVGARVARAGVTTRDPGRPSLNRASPGMEPVPAAPGRSSSGWPRPGCRRCRGRPGSSSTSTRCAATWRCVRELAGPGVPVRPVVKADAYGHGAVPIALALEAAGADGFCVAAFDEAARAARGRRAGADPRALSRAGRLGRRRRAPRHRGGGRRRGGRRRDRAGRRRPSTRRDRWLSSSRSRPGSGGAGSPRPSWSPPRARSRRRPGHRPDRAVDPFPGRRGRGQHGRPGGPVRGGGRAP